MPRDEQLVLRGRMLVLRWAIAQLHMRCDRDGRNPHRDELDTLEWHVERLRKQIHKLQHQSCPKDTDV